MLIKLLDRNNQVVYVNPAHVKYVEPMTLNVHIPLHGSQLQPGSNIWLDTKFPVGVQELPDVVYAKCNCTPVEFSIAADYLEEKGWDGASKSLRQHFGIN